MEPQAEKLPQRSLCRFSTAESRVRLSWFTDAHFGLLT